MSGLNSRRSTSSRKGKSERSSQQQLSDVQQQQNYHPQQQQQSRKSNNPALGGGFSKMHLSALFQRRQQGRNVDERSEKEGSAYADEPNQAMQPTVGQIPDSNTDYTTTNYLSPRDATVESMANTTGSSPQPNRTYRRQMYSLPSASSPSSASLPPTTRSPNIRRRESNASISSIQRVRRMSHGLASLFSQRSLFEDHPTPQLDPLIVEVFENPDDVDAFREALKDDAGRQDTGQTSATRASIWPSSNALSRLGITKETASMQGLGIDAMDKTNERQAQTAEDRIDKTNKSNNATQPSMTQVSHPRKVGRIAAASDFAPVYERTQRKGKSKMDNAAAREGLVYNVFRFPLLIAIFLVIAIEFAAYVLIRQLVNLSEYLVGWRGYKGTLRARLRRAPSMDDWRDTALELDSYLGYEQWKCEDSSGLYDWILIKKVLQSLEEMRRQDDAEGVKSVLELCLRNNFAGIENFRLYSETFFGTKYLIENYLSEVEEAIAYITATDKITPEAKRQFYRSTQKNMGRSALCLSGGGSFGYYHVGVVRALLDANLLPNIITGTSAGGLIAALACTRTNDELKRLLVPELADRITACEESINVWAVRLAQTGARFDIIKWAEKAQFFTRGSMTFAEAFARTGKTLNISVIPSDRHSPVKLLNHHTAPNCIIWSSLLASAAVPGLLNPVCLMQKTRTGKAVPWNWGHRFKDGSLRVDIPLQDLHSLFNVTYPIVSQVNPHVHLFFFAPKGMPGRPVAHRKGKGWRGGFLLSASEHVLKLNLSMNFKIIRDLDLLPSLLGQDWSSVFLQRFGGAVTIWPKTRAWDWVRILSDPDRKELSRMLQVGQIVTFPKLHMIENRVRLERMIEQGRRANRRVLRAEQRAAATAATPVSAPGTSLDGHDAVNGMDSGGEPITGERAGDGVKSMKTTDKVQGVGSAGILSQSDTDGTGEENFFSRNDTQRDETQAERDHGVQLRRMQRRLATTQAFSRTNTDDTHGGNGTAARDADVDGAYTPDATTPGEQLPRHIRVRSLGIDDDDVDDADEAVRRGGGRRSRYARYAHDADGKSTARLLQRHLNKHKSSKSNNGSGTLAFPTPASTTASHQGRGADEDHTVRQHDFGQTNGGHEQFQHRDSDKSSSSSSSEGEER